MYLYRSLCCLAAYLDLLNNELWTGLAADCDSNADDVRPQIYGYTEKQTNFVDWYPFIVPYQAGEGGCYITPGITVNIWCMTWLISMC